MKVRDLSEQEYADLAAHYQIDRITEQHIYFDANSKLQSCHCKGDYWTKNFISTIEQEKRFALESGEESRVKAANALEKHWRHSFAVRFERAKRYFISDLKIVGLQSLVVAGEAYLLANKSTVLMSSFLTFKNVTGGDFLCAQLATATAILGIYTATFAYQCISFYAKEMARYSI